MSNCKIVVYVLDLRFLYLSKLIYRMSQNPCLPVISDDNKQLKPIWLGQGMLESVCISALMCREPWLAIFCREFFLSYCVISCATMSSLHTYTIFFMSVLRYIHTLYFSCLYQLHTWWYIFIYTICDAKTIDKVIML